MIRWIGYVTFPLLFLLLSGCATPINTKALEASKNRTFSIGIIKAAVGMPFLLANISKKTEALGKIPIENICEVLSTHFNLIIDPDYDHTIRTVVEDAEGQQASKPSASPRKARIMGIGLIMPRVV